MNGPRVIVPDKIFPAQPNIYLLGQSQLLFCQDKMATTLHQVQI